MSDNNITAGIADLISERDNARNDRDLWRNRAMAAEGKINAAKNIITGAIDNEYLDIDEDFAKELADALGIELTKTIEGTVTIEYSITLKVPLDVKAEDIDDSFFEADLRYDGEGELDEWNCNDTTLSLD